MTEEIPKAGEIAPKKRDVEDIVAEVLEISRAEANSRKLLEGHILHIEETLDRAPFGDYATNFFAGQQGAFTLHPGGHVGPLSAFVNPPAAVRNFSLIGKTRVESVEIRPPSIVNEDPEKKDKA